VGLNELLVTSTNAFSCKSDNFESELLSSLSVEFSVDFLNTAYLSEPYLFSIITLSEYTLFLADIGAPPLVLLPIPAPRFKNGLFDYFKCF